MKALAGVTTALFATAALPLVTIAGLATLTATVRLAASPGDHLAPSIEATEDIPSKLLPIFQAEATQYEGLPWTVLAGISRVESNHGLYGGASIDAAGVVSPPIIGIALDGTGGTARILDSDGGRWDQDLVFDRAVGPFQFIPSSWRIFGGDGNGDGIADPHNLYDAVPAMRRHLSPEGRVTDVRAAIFSYNHSDAYVDEVLQWARRYTAPPTTVGGNYALPVPLAAIGDTILVGPHHDYPAWDAPVPVGTPLFAITDGTIATAAAADANPTDPNGCGSTVAMAGVDGAHYLYCHLSIITVSADQPVTAGTLIGYNGGQPGGPGAGNTTGPHLHLEVRVAGAAVCPQPILLAIAQGQPIPPSLAPTTGCVSGKPVVDWSRWLDQLRNAEASR